MTLRSPEEDRRGNGKLRETFDAAYVIIEPFFDPNAGWGGQSLEHLAFRVVRENFPSLSGEEVHTIIVAAHRVYIERNPRENDHLKRPAEVKRAVP